MNFYDQDRLDVQSHLSIFGEKIMYKGVEITAIVDYSEEVTDQKGQRDIANIVVSVEDVLIPAKGDSVILPNAGTYVVEDSVRGDINTWSLRLRDNQRSGLGRVR